MVGDMGVGGKGCWRIEESRSRPFYGPEEVKRRSANFGGRQPPSKKGKSNIANFVVPLPTEWKGQTLAWVAASRLLPGNVI